MIQIKINWKIQDNHNVFSPLKLKEALQLSINKTLKSFGYGVLGEIHIEFSIAFSEDTENAEPPERGGSEIADL